MTRMAFKPVPVSEFRINARHIAELMWGTGGTSATRTNRKGAYYYSCSGHGGYVVDCRALTIEEKEAIWPYCGSLVGPHNLHTYLANASDGTCYVTAVQYMDFSCDARVVRSSVPRGMQPVGWAKHQVYLFEEDCDWSILETFTDIRTAWTQEDPERREAHEKAIKESFKSWHSKKATA